MTVNRFLTPEAKTVELAYWEAAKASHLADPPTGFVAGCGYPDPEIFDWCDRLNALEGICTLQSCAGHRCSTHQRCAWCNENTDPDEEPDHVWSGQVWLWLDKDTMRLFDTVAPGLASNALIEKVSRHYHIDGKEIVDIVFKGAGTDQLNDSMQVLVECFTGLTAMAAASRALRVQETIGEMLYFGCWNQSGHYLHNRHHSINSTVAKSYGCPWPEGHGLDGTFAPRCVGEDESLTALTYVHGWTILAMWDRSVDKRFASNAAFLAKGRHSESAMWRAAWEQYPRIAARLKAAPPVEARG